METALDTSLSILDENNVPALLFKVVVFLTVSLVTLYVLPLILARVKNNFDVRAKLLDNIYSLTENYFFPYLMQNRKVLSALSGNVSDEDMFFAYLGWLKVLHSWDKEKRLAVILGTRAAEKVVCALLDQQIHNDLSPTFGDRNEFYLATKAAIADDATTYYYSDFLVKLREDRAFGELFKDFTGRFHAIMSPAKRAAIIENLQLFDAIFEYEITRCQDAWYTKKLAPPVLQISVQKRLASVLLELWNSRLLDKVEANGLLSEYRCVYRIGMSGKLGIAANVIPYFRSVRNLPQT